MCSATVFIARFLLHDILGLVFEIMPLLIGSPDRNTLLQAFELHICNSNYIIGS